MATDLGKRLFPPGMSTAGWSFTYDRTTRSIVATGPRDEPTATEHLFCHSENWTSPLQGQDYRMIKWRLTTSPKAIGHADRSSLTTHFPQATSTPTIFRHPTKTHAPPKRLNRLDKNRALHTLPEIIHPGESSDAFGLRLGSLGHLNDRALEQLMMHALGRKKGDACDFQIFLMKNTFTDHTEMVIVPNLTFESQDWYDLMWALERTTLDFAQPDLHMVGLGSRTKRVFRHSPCDCPKPSGCHVHLWRVHLQGEVHGRDVTRPALFQYGDPGQGWPLRLYLYDHAQEGGHNPEEGCTDGETPIP